MPMAKAGSVCDAFSKVPSNGCEVEVVDRGPGIEDLDRAMQDHYSSSGTLGLGLPGVKRLVDQFTIASGEGQGTRVTVRMCCSGRKHRA